MPSYYWTLPSSCIPVTSIIIEIKFTINLTKISNMYNYQTKEIVEFYRKDISDEFPNSKIKNEYLIQEFFDVRCSFDNSTIVCSQASPEKWPELFEIRSFGESIRGRLQGNAVVMGMKGPDLRLFKPDAE